MKFRRPVKQVVPIEWPKEGPALEIIAFNLGHLRLLFSQFNEARGMLALVGRKIGKKQRRSVFENLNITGDSLKEAAMAFEQHIEKVLAVEECDLATEAPFRPLAPLQWYELPKHPWPLASRGQSYPAAFDQALNARADILLSVASVWVENGGSFRKLPALPSFARKPQPDNAQ